MWPGVPGHTYQDIITIIIHHQDHSICGTASLVLEHGAQERWIQNGRAVKMIKKENNSLFVERGVKELGQLN